ncbi:MAG: helix-hairpin-helix domain-containing protein [Actinomycetota bacterium]|nr:helix-hairpin-helix domain-containing protein [Actinomycetota bacterium]MDH4353833.1 helix-hairpin-helix domain-containing protein [Actinomycetota bacterium]MDH5277510.1 helix-hairpin-helix domain-containing protein [Actinomycetota bacterium]
MWTSSREHRQAQTRQRLSAVVAGWVPTPESVRQELADLASPGRGGGSEAAADAPRPNDDDHALPSGRPAGGEPTASVAWDDAAPPPPRRRIDASVLPAVLLVTVAALVGALALWLLAWPRGQAVPTADPVVLPATSGAAGTSGDPATSPTSSSETVVVDVAGAVRRPGVIELPAGARVIDALDAAGGALPRADTTPLNLARVLLDGEQVLVLVRGRSAAVPGAGSAGTSTTVNLNTATVEQLDTLPGIGPVLAQRILDWRTANGGFASVDQLLEVSGIGDATFADLEPLVQV